MAPHTPGRRRVATAVPGRGAYRQRQHAHRQPSNRLRPVPPPRAVARRRAETPGRAPVRPAAGQAAWRAVGGRRDEDAAAARHRRDLGARRRLPARAARAGRRPRPRRRPAVAAARGHRARSPPAERRRPRGLDRAPADGAPALPRGGAPRVASRRRRVLRGADGGHGAALAARRRRSAGRDGRSRRG